VIRVVAAVVLDRGHVLLTRRLKGKHLAGYWEFPGGKVEPGEFLDQALRREMREELDAEGDVGAAVAVLRHTYAERGEVELHFLRFRLTGGPLRALGCAEWRWVPLAELGTYRLPPADAPVVELLVTPASD
jgi:mutator protein MutT